jgi:hypothetical protein
LFDRQISPGFELTKLSRAAINAGGVVSVGSS